ncbi:MAG: urea carboxylase-associated family protein [Candidatus Rokubacteria bacterium]|nr:urea carboxylase-associated family protein [Candidatus Rokubacteria bacterium]
MPPIHIPATTGRAVTLRAGQTLRIVNVEGTQVADFIAYNADDMTEALSTIHTLVSLGRLFPTAGDQLRSNRRRPMVEILRDDTGRHDMLIAACDPWRYEYDFGVTGHRSCSDNFLQALREWRIERHQLPHPVNFFQNMRYPDGRVEFGESIAKAGDAVELRALINLVAAVSACPMDLNPISGYKTRDLAIEVV